MIKIHGIMVMKNESSRYLRSCLEWMSNFFDSLFIYDDQSTDSSVEIASNFGLVKVRESSVPSFIENESAFRMSAWKAFEESIKPSIGDWVFSFDADEFLVFGEDLVPVIETAQSQGCVGVSIPFPEVFDIQNDTPFVRVDGFWGSIRGPRLFEYRHGGVWNPKKMGCGSEPTYVSSGSISYTCQRLAVLHYGYAKDIDKQKKWERYGNMDFHGHDDAHIRSIMADPTLERWSGQIPVVAYGE
jgi:glycosyltransferase involved in cell wall biosynthesis